MNPSNNEASGMKLPPPMIEQAPVGPIPESGSAMPVGQKPASPEIGRNPGAPSAGQAQAIPIPMPIAPIPMPIQQHTGGPASATPTAGLKASDDTDLIEKEWVNKAKLIVERTRDDPYKQSEELTGVKVDYMKKRYNKSIKLNK